MVPCNLRDGFTKASPYVNYRCRDFKNYEVRDMMLAQAVEWFLKSCINLKAMPRAKFASLSTEERKQALNNLKARAISFEHSWHIFERLHNKEHNIKKTPFFTRAAKSIESSEFYLGNLIHMLEDSYSGAHCARDIGVSGRLQEGPILYFQDYSAQDSGGHANADSPSCVEQFQKYWDCGGVRTLHREQDDRFLKVDKECRKRELHKLLHCYHKEIGVDVDSVKDAHQHIHNPISKAKTLWSETKKTFSYNGKIKTYSDKKGRLENGQTATAPEWAAAPGAIKATQSVKRVMEIYREYTYTKASQNIGVNARCAKGAEVLVKFLKKSAWALSYPDAYAGGTQPEYGGKMCPKATEVIDHLADYNNWDHSLGAIVKGWLTTNVASRWIHGLYSRSLGGGQAKRVHLDGLEVTCMSKCKPIAGVVNRVATSCMQWNKATGHYELKCCIDLSNEAKFGVTMNKGRADPSYDARFIHRSISGAGTDDTALINTLTQRTPKELKAIMKSYHDQKLGSGNMLQDIRDDTSDDFAAILTALLTSATRSIKPGNKRRDARAARKLYDAIDGLGTKRQDVLQVFMSSTPARLRVLNRVYKRMFKDEDLIEAIKGDFSGKAEQALLAMFHDITHRDTTFGHKDSSTKEVNLGITNTLQERASQRNRIEHDLAALERDMKALEEERK
eukprot:TRINITY_DN2751_c0_g1_i1.p1 TRINITY_DN2751_c0_g1~~TRINITY_DN2751_c0_g1_i1.p1  ORF type:complete len:676 (+),score=256.77 TRINITY_DN2751_c0_g1_i1:728-2755(+)